MIALCDPKFCTGCSACAQSCGHAAIKMVADDEGFLQPSIDVNKCVECGICIKNCPELNPIKRLNYGHQDYYAFINEEDRKKSSSGGAFSVFAKWILKQGGIVYGAAYGHHFKVLHIGVENVDELYKLRGSKYVQSEMGNVYKQVREQIKQNRMVLFVGTGCQVAGLYAFLNDKRYEGLLYTLDLVCHGTPSYKTFKAYLDKLQEKRALDCSIEAFSFRKIDSWSIIPSVKFAQSKWEMLDLSENAYMDAFFKGLTFRESCYNCQYCNTMRIGTFTIADFWGVGRHGLKFRPNIASGVSLVIDNMGIIPSILREIQNYAYIEKRSKEEALIEQVNLKTPMRRLLDRSTAVKDMINSDISLLDYSKKYGLPFQATIKWRIQKWIKNTICTLGLYNAYKTIIYKFENENRNRYICKM